MYNSVLLLSYNTNILWYYTHYSNLFFHFIPFFNFLSQIHSFEHQQTGNPLARNESDSAALAAKVAKKEAQKKEEASNLNGANVKIVRKKGIRKEDAGLDDLLSAGLKPGKK